MCNAGVIPSQFDRVDDNILLQVVRQLDQADDVVRAACVSRRWNALLKQVCHAQPYLQLFAVKMVRIAA